MLKKINLTLIAIISLLCIHVIINPVNVNDEINLYSLAFRNYTIPTVIFAVVIIYIVMATRYLIAHNMKFKERIISAYKFIDYHVPEMLTFYLIAFKFYTLYVNDSSANKANIIITLIYFILCGIYFLSHNMKLVIWKNLIIFSILAIIPVIFSMDVVFVMLIALALTYLEKGYKPYLKAMYISIAIWFVITLLLGNYGMIKCTAIDANNRNSLLNKRYDLGFTHPNTVYFIYFLFSICYVMSNKFKIYKIILLFIISIGLFIVTNSRTGFVCCIGLYLIFAFQQYFNNNSNCFIKYFSVLLFPMFTLLSIILSLYVNVDIENPLNLFFNDRPHVIYRYLKNGQYFSFFGMDIIDPHYASIDNMYMYVFILEGTITYAVYLSIYIIIAIYYSKKKSTYFLLMYFVYLIYSLFEATMLSYIGGIMIVDLLIYYLSKVNFMKKDNISFENAKICIPTSSGGHLTHMMLLRKVWENNDRFWVTFNKIDAQSQLTNERKYWCYYPTNGNYFNLIRNFFLAWKVLKKEKPDIIISSGAAISIPFFWLGKKFFRCKCIYVEVFDRINANTKSGKFCYKYADKFIVQWDEMLEVYPKAINLGKIF